MTLLDSFDEPVIPTDFYQRCLDAHRDPALSQQVLCLMHHMPTLHCSDNSSVVYNTAAVMYVNSRTVEWSKVHSLDVS